MRKYVLVILFSFCFIISFAQRKTYSTTNPKAIRTFENARQLYDDGDDANAIKEAENAARFDTAFVEPWLLIANIYQDKKNIKKAKENYRKAMDINPDFFPKALHTLGKMEFASGEYEDAKKHFEKFLAHKEMTPQLLAEAKQYFSNCEFAITAIKNPVPFIPVNLGDSINSEFDEYFPAITGDGGTFLFTRKVKMFRDRGPAIPQEDFFVSTKANGVWMGAVPVKEINTSGNEGAPSLSADGQYLFFISCAEAGGEYSGNRHGEGSCDIFIAKKLGNKWNNPRNLGQPINSGRWESQPSFSSDGRTLYFIRADRGINEFSRPDYNIYMTRINDDFSWTEPEKLSDKINTQGNEQSVFIHPDNQTLYFSSDGHPGMGGLDIFMSRRQPDGEWGEPVNLGYPINTSGDEASLLVGPSGDIAYFSSDRPGGRGGLDLYSFALYDAAKPQKVAYLKGHVMDVDTKASLAANFELIDLATGNLSVSSTSNPGNGEFVVVLPAGKNYALNVSRENYLFYSEHFEMKDSKSAREPYLKDIYLKPIKAGESIVLNNIFYETAKYDLKNESKIELDKLVSFMKKNPKVKIEISGHTDNVGSKPSNQVLSVNRAKSVVEYLVAHGIANTRLTSKGYGDSKPIAENNSEAGRAKNRRTELTIVSVN